MSTRIAITTPTGNIGRKVTELLLDAQEQHDLELVLLARKPESVERAARRGAEVVLGDLASPDFVANATQGVDALFWLTPQAFAPGEEIVEGYQRYGRAAAHAVKTNRIPHVVHLSGFVTERDNGLGPIIDGLKAVEQLLDEAASNVTHVRAAFFMENYLGQLDAIRDANSVFFPVRGDTTVAMAATRDIAAVMARELLDRNWTGRRTLSVLGPADLSFAEAAEAIGRGIGRSISHVTVSPEQARLSMVGAGMSAGLAEGFLQIFSTNDKDGIHPEPARDETSTTATSLEEFARTVIKPLLSEKLVKRAI